MSIFFTPAVAAITEALLTFIRVRSDGRGLVPRSKQRTEGLAQASAIRSPSGLGVRSWPQLSVVIGTHQTGLGACGATPRWIVSV